MRRWSTGMVVACVGLVACSGAFHAREQHAAEWYALDTAHVRLATDVGSREARETAWALEELHHALRAQLFACEASAALSPIDVTLLARAEDYAAIAAPGTSGTYWPAQGELVALAPHVAMRAGDALDTYTHELTHRFVAACFPGTPAWLGEGLATYFETMRLDGDVVRVGAQPASLVAHASSVSALARAPDPDLDAGARATAWAFVHAMLGEDDAMRTRFARYLAAPSSGIDAFFSDVDLDAYVAAHLGSPLAERSLARVATAIGEPVTRRLSPGEVHVRWAELLARTGDASGARAHLALAERSPELEVHALLLRGLLADDLARRDCVVRAEAIAPEAREVLDARAWIAIADDGTIDERESIVHALASLADPTALELTRWADLLRLNGDAQPAVALSERAVQLAPTSWEAYASLALSFASVHRYAESRATFRRARSLTSHHLPGVLVQLERLEASVQARMPRPPGDVPAPTQTASVVLDLARDPVLEVRGETEASEDAQRFGGVCAGFVGRAPAVVIEVPADAPAITLFAHASGATPEARDLVLVVETSTGAVQCDDDSGGWPDPSLFAQLPAGPTRVWVGTYEQARAGTAFTLTIARGRSLGEGALPTVCGLSTGDGPDHGPVVVGARVVLGRHTPVDGGGDDGEIPVEGSTNWVPDMEAYVGREATVTRLEGIDGAGCPMVHVDVDAGAWLWRVRDLRRPGG